MSDRDIFLEVASRIGKRLAKQALWDGSICTWEVMQIDLSQLEKRKVIPTMAAGSLYQGTSGIALFLAELFNLTYDDEIKHTAEGAIRHAIADADKLPQNSFGFHGGRVGIAYVAMRMGLLFDNPEYMNEAIRIIEPLSGNEHQDRGIDVIGGAAGAIPALLYLDDFIDNDFMLNIAINLGEHLIKIANKESCGWSWGTLGVSSVRNLMGLAHGAAGCGYALLELYQATKSNKFLYAAEQAFLYERQFFNEKVTNWPDFRHSELSEYISAGRIDELKSVVKAGKLPPYKVKYMSAWCHGAPGIGLTRVRAFELLGHEIYRIEAGAAIEATKISLKIHSSNYSLCHGLGGNCELLLFASDIFDNAALLSLAETYGMLGWETIEKVGKKWPCGTLGQISDPSLMIGEAGIGYFYLRLFTLKTPSVLLICAPEKDSDKIIIEGSSNELREKYINEFFGRTIQIINLIEKRNKTNFLNKSHSTPDSESDVQFAYKVINRIIQIKKGQVKQFLEDVFMPERIKYELSFKIDDFTEEFLENLNKSPEEDIKWNDITLYLSPFTRILQTQWKRDNGLPDKKKSIALELEPNKVFYILYRLNNKIQICEIDKFAFFVLNSIKKPAKLVKVVSTIKKFMSLKNVIDIKMIEEKIILQLKYAYNAGIIKLQK